MISCYYCLDMTYSNTLHASTAVELQQCRYLELWVAIFAVLAKSAANMYIYKSSVKNDISAEHWFKFMTTLRMLVMVRQQGHRWWNKSCSMFGRSVVKVLETMIFAWRHRFLCERCVIECCSFGNWPRMA